MLVVAWHSDPAGTYFSVGSSRFTKPLLTISASRVVVNVFVIEAMSKSVFPFTFVMFALEMLPEAETLVPFGVITPTTIDIPPLDLLPMFFNISGFI